MTDATPRRPRPGLPDTAGRDAAAEPPVNATADGVVTGHVVEPAAGTSVTAREVGALPVRRPRPGPGLLRAAPNVARVAAESALQLAGWSLGATIASANFVTRRALDGESPGAIMQQAATELRHAAWRALGLDQTPSGEVIAGPTDDRPRPGTDGETPSELQRRGTDLLRRSNDVTVVEDTHPAFSRILTEITPDEARILRYLYLEGPQPSVDVRTFRPFGIGSVLIAAGLNMIAEYAGCRSVDRTNTYLTNLSRLGLIDLSEEQVSNPSRYQVVEAQPKVLEALRQAGRLPKIIHRSITLTSFGEEFVRTCLPLNGRVVPYRARALEPSRAAAQPLRRPSRHSS
jgi:hypothetical protein